MTHQGSNLFRLAALNPAAPGTYWMMVSEPFETERIADLRFCRWKVDSSSGNSIELFSASFPIVLAVVAAVMLGSSRLVLSRIAMGDFLAGKVFGFAMLGFLYVVPVAAMVITAAKGRTPEPERPRDLPIDALFGAAFLSRDGQHGVACQGWFWIEGPWLRFEGELCQFRLAARDFSTRKGLVKALGGQVSRRLNTPDKLPRRWVRLSVRPSGRSGSEVRELRDRFRKDLELWELCSDPQEESLFPPIRTRFIQKSVTGRALWSTLAAGVVAFGIGASLPLLFPETTAGQASPWLLGIAVAFLIWIAPLVSLAEVKSMANEDRKLDRLVEPRSER